MGIQQYFVTLNKIKFPGPYELPPRMLKELAEEISEPLAIIFEKSWRTGGVPIDCRKEKWSLFSKRVVVERSQQQQQHLYWHIKKKYQSVE